MGKDKKLNPACRYLAIGAGAAIPELILARKLHIPDEHITLVEKQPLPDILEELRAKYPRINYRYGEGLYHFLQTTHEKYDLVSAFLMEKLFSDPQRMRAFVALLSPKVKPEGIICVYPYYGEDLRHVWRNNGFKPFYEAESDNPVSFYTFKGIPK